MPTPTRIAVVGVPPLLRPWLLDLLHALPITVDADFVSLDACDLSTSDPGTDGIVWCPVDVPSDALDPRLLRLRRFGVPLLVADLFGTREVADTARRANTPLVRFGAGRDELFGAIERLVRAASGEFPVAEHMPAARAAAPDLSEREEHVLRLYAAGVLIKQIAFELGLSLNTVKSYRARIQAKYAAVGVDLRQRLDFHIEARRRYADFDASDVFTRGRADRRPSSPPRPSEGIVVPAPAPAPALAPAPAPASAPSTATVARRPHGAHRAERPQGVTLVPVD
ncbi:LuxR C-terminal-related transcriptional regulator [Pseudoclavibacter chungangensis]|uniref:LuxR C-terminal-related transcriptional regulator n=1 Tax=Pseudoclavibacter chungangensis TaxID=587635 RepID=UPI00362792AC